MIQPKPLIKPNNPCFSSGPCAKRPGYSPAELDKRTLGRSHRGKIGKKLLKEAIDKTRDILGIPSDYLLGIVPASDTGAFEMAMWNLLGERPVEVLYFESFGKAWADDIRYELKLEKTRYHAADYGFLPDLSKINFNHDLVFTWNGTTSGVRVPGGDFIPELRRGLTLCDATSAVFAMDIPWDKLDVVTFSWQKALGGEAGHGMLVLSPRAVKRLETFSPDRPLPKIFRLKKNNRVNYDLFEGSTINTPSLLCTEDYLDALRWAKNLGGLEALIKRSKNNLEVIASFVQKNDWLDFLASNPQVRSNTSVCLTLELTPEQVKRIAGLMEEEQVAYDISSYRDAPPGLRFWCGGTVEKEDLQKAMPWLQWAYEKVKT